MDGDINVCQDIETVNGQVIGVLINNLYELNRFDESIKCQLQAIYHAKINAFPEATKWYIALGLWHLDHKLYAEAWANFKEIINRGTLPPAVAYYRTLATIGGRHPKLVPRPVIRDLLKNSLEYAARQDSSQPHYWYLWALLKHKHDIPGTFVTDPYTTEQLLTYAGDLLVRASEAEQAFFSAEINHMLTHVPDPDHFIQNAIMKHRKGLPPPRN
jgi:hypothetical protein